MGIPFKQMLDIVQGHVSKGEQERKKWAKWHAWYLSDFWDEESLTGSEDEGITLETNYPFAFIDTMIANVCPTNPMVTISANQKSNASAARMREQLVNHTLRRDKAHAKGWDMATFTAMCGRGVSKVVYNTRSRKPTIKVINPKNFFFDMSVDWEDTRYTIEAIPLTKAEVEERVKRGEYNAEVAKKVHYSEVPTWMYDKSRGGSFCNNASQEAFKWAVVYEVYDFTGDKMYHISLDAKEALYEGELPFKYCRNPYSLMIFNKNLLDTSGVSDVKLIERLQERLNEIDTLELLFSHTCIPVSVVNESLLDNPENGVDAIRNATKPGDIIRLKSQNPVPIEQIMTWTKTPTMSPSWDKMREQILAKIEFTLGIPQYSRGAYGGAEVATELALVDTATRTRNGRRIRVIEDWICDIAKKILGLWKEFLEDEAQLTLRDPGSRQSFDVDRASMAFPVAENGVLPADDFEDEWAYEFDAAAYSPTENHRLVQLQKLQQFMEVLLQNPGIDQQALMAKLTDLLGMDDIRAEPGSQQPTAQPGQPMPPGAQPPMPGGTPADVMPTGGAASAAPQQALEPILPAGSRGSAAQPIA